MTIGNIIVLSGAGISQESGLATFRDSDGEWSRVRLEDVATPEGYRRDPARVHAFYNARRQQLGQVKPNAAHFALARLEESWPGQMLVVTQNIDDLHERAGTKALIHMHGELNKARCDLCGSIAPWSGDLNQQSHCGDCRQAGHLRPHVVWFGEIPLEMGRISKALNQCHLFVAVGTSGNVYPAAGFVSQVRSRPGTRTVELNLLPSEGASLFAEANYGPASEVVPAFVDHLLNSL
ncbi:MAG TPA: NAD-dependent deacylase [Rhodospirillaceae bacterium]|nr:NAD-dependent deacylase [Rhodospirillaceae bacterium]